MFPVRQPVLIMIQGPEPGSYCKLPDNRVTTIGRSSRNSVRIANPSISRFHCEITCANRQWILSDLHSKKGTIVNGELVADRCELKPGDIIRLSTVIFRFDTINESIQQYGALLAIREAELDQKLITAGKAVGSLDDVLVRSRLDTEAARERRDRRRRVLGINVAFVAGVSLAVAVLVSLALFYAHFALPGQAEVLEAAQDEADAVHEEARQVLASGAGPEALQRLQHIQEVFPGTEAAQKAEREYAELMWSVLQRGFATVASLEAGGDYAGALGVYNGLRAFGATGAIASLLEQRREYTVRLAHASFKQIVLAAHGLLEDGDREGAMKLYRRARDKIGIPELAEDARKRIARLGSP